nr:UDP-N-acetylmuramoyl-tripeptide--D-alanyl-D-alanine ligase [Natronoglycomyces albus]
MTLAEVAAATGGKLSPNTDASTTVTATVEYDSRKVTTGGLFVALPGERVNGHDYAAKAHQLGAVATIATQEVAGPAIYVADGLTALADLASETLRRSQATVIAVTGSNGKTSTKDLIGQLCASLGPTVATEANFNNELGHPYTVCRTQADTQYLVLETAARFKGNITQLCHIAPPHIGVVLNVGISHLDGFGSIENTAHVKGELPRFLPAEGTAILNADDHRVAAMASETAAEVLTFGIHSPADVRAEKLHTEQGRPHFTLVTPSGTAQVELPLYGTHQVSNALAAAAVAHTLRASAEHIAAELGRVARLSERRMDLYRRGDGITVIDDSYNANPASMTAAIHALANVPTTGRRFAVLGLMADLIDLSDECHHELGKHAAEQGIDHVIAVGDGTQPIIRGAQSSAGSITATHVPQQGDAIDILRQQLRPGDAVLVKGSRYRTWDIADFLRLPTLSEEDSDS